jgi:uncharacterized protein (DUF1778 family)
MEARIGKRSRPTPMRLSEREHRMLAEAAALEHDYLSSFVRRAALKAAERTLRQAGESARGGER